MPGTVVPQTAGVTEAEFAAAMLSGLARCEKAVGSKALAYVVDVSAKQLSNIMSRGAMPAPKRLFDATKACPSALDDIADLYGLALVPKRDLAEDAQGTLPIATLLAKVAAAECPSSADGVKKSHRELLDMETEIRAVNRLTKAWIARINAIRK